MKYWLTTALLLVIVPGTEAHERPRDRNGDPLADTTAHCARERELKILTWNIYMLPGIVPMKGQVDRARAIADTLDRSDCDIIVFEEAFHHGAVRTLRERLRSAYPNMYGPFNRGGSPMRFSSGVWVVSRLPLRLLGTIEFQEAKSFDRAARKGAALLEGEFNGRRFQILGTHVQADDFPTVRALQLKEIYTGLLAKFRCDGVPQIICGDMNTENIRVAEYDAMLFSLDAQDGASDGAQQTSYDAQTNRLADKVWKNTRSTVDYILLRLNGAVISSVKRSMSVIRAPWRKRHVDLSDHYGVLCELVF